MEKQDITKLINILKKDNLLDWKKIIEKYNISNEVLKKIIMLETNYETLAKLRSFIEKCYEYIEDQIFNKVLLEILEANLTTPRQFLNLEFYIPDIVKDRKVNFQDFKDLINCGFLDTEFFDSFLRKIFLPSREPDGPQLAKDYVNYAVNNNHPGYVLFFKDLYQANCPIYKLKVVYKEETRFWISTIDMIEQGASKEDLEKMMPILENINGIEEARGKLIMNQIAQGARADKISIIANKKLSYDQMLAIIQLMDSGMPLETVKKIANPKYTPTQMYCLKNLLNHNYNLGLFEFNGGQIEQLSKGIEDNIEVPLYYNKNYSTGKMYYIRIGLKENLDISLYTDTHYSDKQIKEIYLGLNQKLDVNKYANPEFSHQIMKFIRETLYRQNNEKYRLDKNTHQYIEKLQSRNKTFKFENLEHKYTNDELEFLISEQRCNNDWEKYKSIQVDRLCNPNYSLAYIFLMANIMMEFEFNDKELDFLFNTKFHVFANNNLIENIGVLETIAKAIKNSGLEKCQQYLTEEKSSNMIKLLAQGLAEKLNDEQLVYLAKQHHFVNDQIEVIIEGLSEGLTIDQVSLYAQLGVSSYKMRLAKNLLTKRYSYDLVALIINSKFDKFETDKLANFIRKNYNYNQILILKKYIDAECFSHQVDELADFIEKGYDENILEMLINPTEGINDIDITETINNDLVSDEIYKLLLKENNSKKY